MTDNNFPTVSRLDAQILAAAVLVAVGVSATGRVGAEALLKLEDDFPQITPLTNAGMILLTATKPIDLDGTVGPEDGSTRETRKVAFEQNMERVTQLAQALLRFAATSTESEKPDAPRVIDVAPDGTPILEPEPQIIGPTPDAERMYTLSLTHDELHLIEWAIRVAESARVQDTNETLDCRAVYDALRREIVTDKVFDVFGEKFDAAHDQARLNDGE